MNLRTIAILCCVFLTSCSGWETKKIPTKDFLEQEWKTIDITEVDVYPSFAVCDSISESDKIKHCFEDHITASFYEQLSKHTIVVQETLDETVWIDFVVNEKGKICLDSIHLTPTIRKEIPNLPLWINDATTLLPVSYPATKRGIPVKTRFKIPVVLKVDE